MLSDHGAFKLYQIVMKDPSRPPPGMTDEVATKFISILRLINRVMNPNGFPEDVWFEDEKSVWFQRHVALSQWRDSASSSSGGPPAQGPPAQGLEDSDGQCMLCSNIYGHDRVPPAIEEGHLR